MLLLYTLKTSPRLAYIADVLSEAMGVNLVITIDYDTFRAFTGARIEYTTVCSVEDCLHIVPATLLFENDIKNQLTELFYWHEVAAFFKTGDGEIPFDVFAASFYLVSRYEEYLDWKPDFYGRYPHENSLAFTEGFLSIPLINLWVKELNMLLKAKHPLTKFNQQPFAFLPTYDVDMAWRYRHKGIFRNTGGLVQNLLKGQWKLVMERLNVLAGLQKDPFDLFDWFECLHKTHGLRAHYFLLVAARQKQYDKNTHPRARVFFKLVNRLATENSTGLHPSWQSGDTPVLLTREKQTLERITQKPVTSSRQHYLRLRLPETYRRIAALAICNEYSMGYGSINGFRASYCLPFFWYDLAANEVSQLKVYPFCWMDANSYYEQHFTLAQAKEELEHYRTITRSVNGMLITVCHNHTLGNKDLFDGWAEMYAGFIAENFPVAHPVSPT